MTGKITLITPPDFFENRNRSILFVHLDDREQDQISQWLGKSESEDNINLYVYTGETEVAWALWAVNLCQHVYVNLDEVNDVSRALSGYLLSKNDVYYKTTNENLAAIYSHINNNRISSVEKFLESVLSG
jgi:hypothetical protein